MLIELLFKRINNYLSTLTSTYNDLSSSLKPLEGVVILIQFYDFSSFNAGFYIKDNTLTILQEKEISDVPIVTLSGNVTDFFKLLSQDSINNRKQFKHIDIKGDISPLIDLNRILNQSGLNIRDLLTPIIGEGGSAIISIAMKPLKRFTWSCNNQLKGLISNSLQNEYEIVLSRSVNDSMYQHLLTQKDQLELLFLRVNNLDKGTL
jgi:ubiquinone biosynthesis protein UbiJ